ncbi:ABC transporter substrate-binding protein [Niveispirillum sp. KHB5.9]|uniref:ABC transporter substrate-binding protein n=1 Tax=Niveispirillum sp. KHB5.9 TaxID=3400269 RepID=UPI003A86D1DD
MRLLNCLLAVLVLLLVPAAAAAPRDTLRIGLQLEPPNLDPTSGAANATDEVVYATLFEGLVRLGPDGSVQPLLASGWTLSADGCTYVFDLRPGIRFHDGAPLTADDVVFSLSRAIGPNSSNAQVQALRGAIRSVTATGPLQVRLELAERDSGFLTLMGLADAVIVSRGAADALATQPVGTGPFRFADWRRGDAVVLDRFDGYWGRPARLSRLVFRFIADPNAAYAAMKAGDLDLFPDFPAPEVLDRLAADPRLKLAITPSEGEVILAMNQRTGPLADIRVRRAIAHALDRQAIIDGSVHGHGTPIGSHFPPQNPDYKDLTGLYPYDITAARRLLAEAGYAKGLDLTLKLPPPSYARRGGEIVAAQLAAVGIRVRIRNIEWAAWLDEVYKRHDFDLTIVSHIEPFDYAIYGRTGYYFGYESPAYRALLSDLKAAPDAGTRHRILGDLQQQLAGDAVNGFLYQYPHLGVQDRDLADLWNNSPNQMLNYATAHFGAGGGEGGGGRAKDGGDAGWTRWLPTAALVVLLGGATAWFGAPYMLARLSVLAGTLLAASLVIFILVQVVPGDPAAFMMGLNASPEAIGNLHRELGLDGPVLVRYLDWVGGLLHGDFGISYTYRVPVADLIGERLSLSLPLTLLATLLSVAIGLPAGYLAAVRQGGWLDAVLSWTMRVGIAVPGFWLAILLVLVFALGLGWFAGGGFPGWDAGIGAGLSALVLPVLALALPQSAILARVARGSLIDVLHKDFIRTARAKGLGRAQAIRRHALPNALGPVLTVLGLQVPFLLAGAAIVENVFYLPGLGRLVLQAIAQRDLIVVQSVVVLLVGCTVFASLLVDMAYALVDPRLRDGGAA